MVVFGGVFTASVLGVPAGPLIEEVASWRVAFAGMSAVAALALALLLGTLPPLSGSWRASMTDLTRLLRVNPVVRGGLVVASLLVTGHFVAYTCLRPIAQEFVGIEASRIRPLLLISWCRGRGRELRLRLDAPRSALQSGERDISP